MKAKANFYFITTCQYTNKKFKKIVKIHLWTSHMKIISQVTKIFIFMMTKDA